MQYPPNDNPTGQQPPYYQPQQPNTHYPPQQPYYPQQPGYPPYGQPPQPGYPPQPPYAPPPPKKHTGLWVGIGIVVLVFFLCVAAASHGSSSPSSTASTNTNANVASTQAPQPTAAPTATPKPLKWTTTHTFKGNGEQKTAIFTAPDDWVIGWACNPASSFGGSYNVIITVYNSDGTMADLAINTICKAGNTSGTTEEHQGGQVYLDVSSEGDWAVGVEEMK